MNDTARMALGLRRQQRSLRRLHRLTQWIDDTVRYTGFVHGLSVDYMVAREKNCHGEASIRSIDMCGYWVFLIGLTLSLCIFVLL